MKNGNDIIRETNHIKDSLIENAEDLKHETMDKVQKGTRMVNQKVEMISEKTPSLLFAGAALASIALSLILQMRGKRQWALFVGHWAPTFMLFGLYNKANKTVGLQKD